MHSADYTVQDVCLSVRLSLCPSVCHTPVFCLNGHISWKFFFTVGNGNIPMGTLKRERQTHGGMKKITIFDNYIALSLKWCKIEPYLLWKANRKPYPSFRMVPFLMTLMTSNPDFKVTIIQCQVTSWYNIELYLQWPTNRNSYMIYQTAPFSMTLKEPYPQFQGHAILWRWISQNTDIISMEY